MSEYPDSPFVQNALLSLAKIELDSGEPKKAIRHLSLISKNTRPDNIGTEAEREANHLLTTLKPVL